MGYTKEISAFTAWLAENPIHATAQMLWVHLLDIWNQSGSPEEWFEVANATLQTRLGVTDKTLGTHRDTLAQKGRIKYEGLERKKFGRYQMILFHTADGIFPPDDQTDGISDGNFTAEGESGGKSDGNSAGKIPSDSMSYIDRKMDGWMEGEIDNVSARELPNPYKTFEKNFEKQFKMRMNKAHYDMLNFYLDQKLTIEVALLALEDAMNNNAEKPKYLWTVFGSLIRNQVLTVPQYAAYMEVQAAMHQEMAATRQGGEQRGKHRANDQNDGKVVSITNGQTGWVRPTVGEV